MRASLPSTPPPRSAPHSTIAAASRNRLPHTLSPSQYTTAHNLRKPPSPQTNPAAPPSPRVDTPQIILPAYAKSAHDQSSGTQPQVCVPPRTAAETPSAKPALPTSILDRAPPPPLPVLLS